MHLYYFHNFFFFKEKVGEFPGGAAGWGSGFVTAAVQV